MIPRVGVDILDLEKYLEDRAISGYTRRELENIAFTKAGEGRLIGSLIEGQVRDTEELRNIGSGTNLRLMHAPVLDLDFPCILMPSRTEGHFHLYMEKEITWEAYTSLLRALYRAGLIQKGWMDAGNRIGTTLIEPNRGRISN
jgi:hypothetical protein